MTLVRVPAAAGELYPADPSELLAQVHRQLRGGGRDGPTVAAPKALIVPRAGPARAAALRRLRPVRDSVRRVVLLGAAGSASLRGLATCSLDYFETPLGQVPLDKPAIALLRALPAVRERDDLHLREHALEVLLPPLQYLLPRFSLVPLLVGETTPETVAAALDTVWGGDETRVLASVAGAARGSGPGAAFDRAALAGLRRAARRRAEPPPPASSPGRWIRRPGA